jgi:hypothetical protein
MLLVADRLADTADTAVELDVERSATVLSIVLIDDDNQLLPVDSDADRLSSSLLVRVSPLVIVTKPVDAEADRTLTDVL